MVEPFFNLEVWEMHDQSFSGHFLAAFDDPTKLFKG